ncbi:MAG: hypothetical protein JWQ98_827 [Chlorobi bacterium]|nr:hypothetical protein [Chlorobiota bacterium]
MVLIWKIWVNAGTPKKALKLCDAILQRMDAVVLEKMIEPYPKINGFMIMFSVRIESGTWNDAVVEAIDLGQRVGHGWLLGGFVYENANGWCNRPSVSGVVCMEWNLSKQSGGATILTDAYDHAVAG